jgi:hypothetical protein
MRSRLALRPITKWIVAGMLATTTACSDERPPAISGQRFDDVPPFDAGDLVVDDAATFDVALPPRGVNPYPAYDLSFTLPYNGPEQNFMLDVEPRAGRLDVHFSIDTTGSFGGEIYALKTSLQDVLVPRLRDRVTDLAIGVSRFGDFPLRPYGISTDSPYDLLTPITTDFTRVARAVFSLDRPLQNGGDAPESWIEALYQIGSGEGLSNGVSTVARFTPRGDVQGSGTEGGVGFRRGSARVVVHVTDATSHDPFDYGTFVPGTHSLSQAASALQRVGARVIGIASGEPARAQLQQFAVLTGAVVPPEGGRCLTGLRGLSRPPIGGMCPLVFDIGSDGTGLADSILDAITRFLDSLAFRTVSGATEGDVHQFVNSIEALSAVPPAGVAQPRREDRLPAGMLDGVPDTFTDVATRTRLAFRVRLRNTRVMSDEFPQVFFLRVTLVGDGVVLGARVLRVLVPEGPKPDSAVDVSHDRIVVEAATPVDAGDDLGTHDDVGDGSDDVSDAADETDDAA